MQEIVEFTSSLIYIFNSELILIEFHSLCLIILCSVVDVSSVLIGAAVGTSVMMILCGIFLWLRKPTPSGRGEAAGLHTVDHQEEDEESVYMNKTMLSESLHYSTVVFPNGAGSEIRGLSALTTDYATIRHSSEQHTEGGATGPVIKEVQEENQTKSNSKEEEEEEVTYGNLTRADNDGAN
ncbi:uncharacterized protein LOC125139588 [Tachysurus fulvidraco]|uniref:uncharacterized protein LOC125139588 n=1 Tax=Tachysurus fulvidraco TaxID=1234273 RepID=UPI001FED6FB0|nr:uncharacterized protein LOC125139588 [Tachysurus fulvidraco]